MNFFRIYHLREESAAKLIQIAWRRYKYAKVRIGEDDDFVLRESQIASFTAKYRNKNLKEDFAARRRSRIPSSNFKSLNSPYFETATNAFTNH